MENRPKKSYEKFTRGDKQGEKDDFLRKTCMVVPLWVGQPY